jgi:hypothetical protein
MWAVMSQFKVLPTNDDFRNLTDAQLDLMIYSMQEDHREMELARKGLTVDSQYYDSSFEEEVWNREVGDWEILREGHDPDDIARQVEAITRAEDAANLSTKFDSLEEYNAFLEAGGKTTRETEVEQHMNRQLEAALEKARRLEMVGGKGKLIDDRDIIGEGATQEKDSQAELDKAAINKSIALFNADEEDDGFTVL